MFFVFQLLGYASFIFPFTIIAISFFFYKNLLLYFLRWWDFVSIDFDRFLLYSTRFFLQLIAVKVREIELDMKNTNISGKIDFSVLFSITSDAFRIILSFEGRNLEFH